jgi:hypothetical protein
VVIEGPEDVAHATFADPREDPVSTGGEFHTDPSARSIDQVHLPESFVKNE